MTRSAMFFAAMVLGTCSLVSQTQDQQQASSNQSTQTTTPAFRVNTEEVNLDMVFHDKKGKAVHDIRLEQVHVYEDGVEQHLATFKYIDGESSAASNAPATPATAGGSIPLDPMPREPMRDPPNFE